MEARLANPRGFCAGVDRAIEIVKQALEIYGAPVYVLHEIVHNKHVLEDLSGRGTVFVSTLSEVPARGGLRLGSASHLARGGRRSLQAGRDSNAAPNRRDAGPPDQRSS